MFISLPTLTRSIVLTGLLAFVGCVSLKFEGHDGSLPIENACVSCSAEDCTTCQTKQPADLCNDQSLCPSPVQSLQIKDACILDCPSDLQSTDEIGPNQIDLKSISYQSLTLEECVALTLANSKVMRDLGASVLRAPNTIETVHGPAIAYSDPRFGEEAALSAFDANLFGSMTFDKNDRVLNNAFFGNDGVFVQDLANLQWGVSKRAATGSIFTMRHTTDYDFNNQLGNRFGTPSGTWNTLFDAEVRQPILQGAGVLFNRIAGPAEQPGAINGLLIARTNTDISLAEFEESVRQLLSDVENAYWDLYFAYRDLDAKIEARNRALETWRIVKAKADTSEEGSSKGGTADKEGQAREQFYRFEAEVVRALNGRLTDGTRTFNGSNSGTFRGAGVRIAERRLRLLAGMKINGNQLLRPADSPISAPIRFDWQNAKSQAIVQRPELRSQRWLIKQRELELMANKNFLMPRLDAIARYRFRGFGNDLIGGDGKFTTTAISPDAYSDLVSGDRQEWQLGVEFNMPIGFRRQHAAIRNGELRLARERAILSEQQREIIFGLSNAIGEVRAAYEAMLAIYNRLEAANDQVQAVTANYERDAAPLDLVLEAQRRLVDAKIQFHQAQIEYTLAVKGVHFEKGTLLEYYKVNLSESEWDPKAYQDAYELLARSQPMSYVLQDVMLAREDNLVEAGMMTVPLHSQRSEIEGFSKIPQTMSKASLVSNATLAPVSVIDRGTTRRQKAHDSTSIAGNLENMGEVPIETDPSPYFDMAKNPNFGRTANESSNLSRRASKEGASKRQHSHLSALKNVTKAMASEKAPEIHHRQPISNFAKPLPSVREILRPAKDAELSEDEFENESEVDQLSPAMRRMLQK